ncbi:crotonase [Acrocarpospora pleiomorpha]|uniref:Crotonase n=1 Tax=Acrocarpospora pleiomorpha TaxID=90975 RepID=A0A5M3Y242_9ACTN|nr:enoyl-CoA hydratase-related protein [Acrocarpospora pleiomorpha]GES25783.1 crotonase [Acrocarpospora pleiomorpha]
MDLTTGTDELLLTREGPVAVLTINRPERLNALGENVHFALRRVWHELEADPTCRVAVVTGAGERAFCTGMDLRENKERGGIRPQSAKATDVRDAGKVSALRNDSLLPVVVAVNGVCAGAGLHFVADGDVVVASEHATFTDTHVSVGQVAALEPIMLAHRIGGGQALRLAVMGRSLRLDADEALRIGLVHEVVAAERLLTRAREIARGIAANSPAAIRASKLAIWGSVGQPLLAGMQHGFDQVRGHWDHPDSKEGPKAFVDKRQPEWADRTAEPLDVLSLYVEARGA